jgi:micrococcal nuclease
VLLALCVGLAGLGALVDDGDGTRTPTAAASLLRQATVPATEVPTAAVPAPDPPLIAPELAAVATATTPATAVPTPVPTDTPVPLPTVPTGIPAEARAARVVEVVDGDTVVLDLDGAEETVQLAGIDAPEAGEPGAGGECFGGDATDRLARTLSADRAVWLVRHGTNRGREGLLRYVWVVGDDGTASFVNESLIRRGFADVTGAGRDGAYGDRLEGAQERARDEAAGLWDACGGAHVPLPPPTPQPSPTPKPTRTPRPTEVLPPVPTDPPVAPACDPNYAGACVPPWPPDVNCGDLPFGGFQRIGGDPHDLDRDNDGIACE